MRINCKSEARVISGQQRTTPQGGALRCIQRTLANFAWALSAIGRQCRCRPEHQFERVQVDDLQIMPPIAQPCVVSVLPERLILPV